MPIDQWGRAVATRGSRAGLLGRRDERRALDELLAGARAGQSATLVLRGEPGIGKTALLTYLRAQSTGCRVVRAAGVQSEMELSYAGLHQLCAPLLTGLDHLPGPQRDALAIAFGLHDGEPPSRFLVGLASLSLLADAGGNQPLVCLIDDAQWLDHASAQTLQFVARRLLAESLLLVFAVRDPSPGETFPGLPELHLTGLSDSDSRTLLASVVTGPLDERVRDRIVAETGGNPLALLELPRGLAVAEIAGGFVRPDAPPLSSQLEQGFLRRVQLLPTETQRLLITAAAEPVGDVTLLWRAAERLGIAVDSAAAKAETSGLITFGARVRFRHPLVRSAAYRAAGLFELRDIHKALAEATDAEREPDRRAWHLARAAAGPDEEVAAELERSAGRASARGGIAAAAAFLDRATELTPEPVRRGARALAAAQAKFEAGAFEAALALAGTAELSRLDELNTAKLTLLRARIFSQTTGAAAALPPFLEAAKRFETLDTGLACVTYRDAIVTALTAGGLPDNLAEAVLAAPKPGQPRRQVRLLEGLARMSTDGYAAGAPLLLEALAGLRADDVTRDEVLGWFQLACRMATDAWDFESWSFVSARLVDAARATGALTVLAPALLLRLPNLVFGGDLTAAGSLAEEVAAVGEATGSGFWPYYGALFLEPWKGREAPTQQAIGAITRALRAVRGHDKVLADTQWAAAVLYNGHGRFEEALEAAKLGSQRPEELGLSLPSMVEYVEAAARLGRPAEAAQAVERIRDMAQATGTGWALGCAAFTQALASEADSPDALYRQAIEHFGDLGIRMLLARSRLCYGEWLRRENRRADARAQLGVAHEMLSGFGAAAFADRARRELQATGVAVRSRAAAATVDALTAQEAQIARLAADGLTNPEIGARLFISPHTVEWHLRKVFTKLGITSRREIATLLPSGTASSA